MAQLELFICNVSNSMCPTFVERGLAEGIFLAFIRHVVTGEMTRRFKFEILAGSGWKVLKVMWVSGFIHYLMFQHGKFDWGKCGYTLILLSDAKFCLALTV